jgi:hypothetical protein
MDKEAGILVRIKGDDSGFQDTLDKAAKSSADFAKTVQKDMSGAVPDAGAAGKMAGGFTAAASKIGSATSIISRFAFLIPTAVGGVTMAFSLAGGAVRSFLGLIGSLVSGAVSTAFSMVKLGLMGIATAAGAASTALVAASVSALKLGSQLSNSSAITGISADKLLVLQQAFKNAGMSAEMATSTIATLQQSIGRAGFISEEAEQEMATLRQRIDDLKAAQNAGMDPKQLAKSNAEIKKAQSQLAKLEKESKGVQASFKRMGLDPESLAQMDGAAQLEALMTGISKLGSNSEKLAVLKSLRLSPDLMGLAKDPNAFKGSRDMLGSLPVVMGQFADKFNSIWNVISEKPGILFQQIGAGFTQALANNPAIQKFLDMLNRLDLTSVGAAIGDRVSGAVDFITATIESGNIGETLRVALDGAFALAVDGFKAAMNAASAAVSGTLETALSKDGKEFLDNFGGALWGVLNVAAAKFGNAMKLLLIELEASLGDSTLSRAWTGVKATANAAGYLGAGALNAATLGLLWDETGAMQSEFKKGMGENLLKLTDPKAALENERLKVLQDNSVPWMEGMTQDQVWEQSMSKLSKAAEKVDDVASKIAVNTVDSYKQKAPSQSNTQQLINGLLYGEQGTEFSRLNVQQQEALRRAIGMPAPGASATPQNSQWFMQPQQAPKTEWVFPDGKKSPQAQAGDGKAVSVLEQIASLLDRNLTALQVA